LINTSYLKTSFPHYKQPDSKDCGPTCLRIIAKYYGKLISLKEIREISETTHSGSSLHLMAIASNGQTEYTRQALDDWYIAEKKEYDAFAAKYPLNGELTKQGQHIKAMQVWAEEEKITHTPTIFINGFELPAAYEVEDLKYVLQ